MTATSISVNLDGLPASMRTGKIWVRYKLSKPNRRGKRKKIPYFPTEDRRASVTDPSSWGTLEECAANVGKHGTVGVGLVLGTDDLVGIDLDDVRNPETGVITAEATAFVKRFSSYAEISPSGTGVHVFARGRLPFHGKNDGKGHEIYASRRFIATTGVAIPGYDGDPQERQDEIDQFVAQFFMKITDVRSAVDFEDDDGTYSTSPVTERVSQARRFLNSVDPAIEGKGGDLQTFTTIVNVIRGFDLDGPEGHALISEFNAEKCIPPWPPAELQRKIEIARKDGRLPRGCLLRPRFRMSDTGNAARLAALCGEDLRYCREAGTFLVYERGRWAEKKPDRVLAMTKKVIADIWQDVAELPTGDVREAVRRHALKTESRTARKAMIDLVVAEKGIAIQISAFDRDPFLLNVANGTLNLRTGKLQDFSRDDFLTKQSTVSWDPVSKCPRFIRFLDEIFQGDKDLIGFIKRMIGYILTGDVTEQVLIFFFGTGRNGKTTLVEIILALLGEFGIQAAPEILSLRKGEVHPTEQADLCGVRLAAAQEVKEGASWDERAVKALTGGDRIRARKMRQDFFEFSPTHKFIVCANHKPVVKGVDEGIWRRIKMVPFKATIPREKCDPKLLEALRAELPGILNWAIEGCLEWQKVGLVPPPEVEAATSRYKAENDVVGRFLDDECEVTSSVREDSAKLYRAFLGWCKDSGEEPPSARAFGERLDERGHKQKKTGGVKYRLGVCMKQPTAEVLGVPEGLPTHASVVSEHAPADHSHA